MIDPTTPRPDPVTEAGVLREAAEAAWRKDWGASVPGQGRYYLGYEPHKATFIRGYEAAALARAEAGVSLEEMGKAWAAVEAALPEHHYFKVEHDSDDDPSWYLAVWRSDGIFPDPIRWAQADTLLDGLTRLALELRTPR